MPMVPQTEVSTSQPHLLEETNYLNYSIPEINDILRAYHDEFLDGKDYTLRVFQRLGENRVRGFGPDFNTTKQNIGMFVPQKLNDLYPGRVSTDRHGREANSLPNEDKNTPWLKNYTRHRVE